MKTRDEYSRKEFFSRTEKIYGHKTIELLAKTKIAVVGIGGVGSAASEILCRIGAENMLLVDDEDIETSNLNRHFQSSTENVGKSKVDEAVMKFSGINPKEKFKGIKEHVTKDNLCLIENFEPRFVLDAVDCVETKILLAKMCAESGADFISSMGAGWKKNPRLVKVSLLSETSVCPLARKMRKELKGVYDFPVVYSMESSSGRGSPIGSSIIVTAMFGLLMADWLVGRVSDCFSGGD
ncbi:ThiF family adenylyltransferase [candidate division WOR-3 bacterium]|nr:ThiF family adenylyltransferase [candidate division WOR-3 bacterium]